MAAQKEREWTEVSVRLAEPVADVVGNRMIELGASGLLIDDSDVHLGEGAYAEEGPYRLATIKCYFQVDLAKDLIAALESFLKVVHQEFPEYPTPQMSISTLAGEDWAHTWKRFFKPMSVGPGIVVKPTWESYKPKDGEMIIEIDPGMAFGTGHHQTTRLCIDAIRRYAQREEVGGLRRPVRSALDVGTGSGILAIVAAKFGIPRVVAIDNDPVAVETAAENVRLNGLKGKVETGTTPIEDLKEEFELVVANILAETIIEMNESLRARLAPGGILILSGILRNKASLVRDAFMHGKLEFLESNNDEEWTSLVFQRT